MAHNMNQQFQPLETKKKEILGFGFLNIIILKSNLCKHHQHGVWKKYKEMIT
jgi:hypothetical protein